MSGDRRHYSPQFKFQVVLELLKGQKSAAQIAREHNLGQDLLSRRRDLFHERGAQIFQDGRAEASADAARIAELERLVAQQAIRYVIAYLVAEKGMTREQAFCVCGATVDLTISEIVNGPNWVVSAYLPLGIFVYP